MLAKEDEVKLSQSESEERLFELVSFLFTHYLCLPTVSVYLGPDPRQRNVPNTGSTMNLPQIRLRISLTCLLER